MPIGARCMSNAPLVAEATVLLITGPAGSGKTSTAEAWASTGPAKSAHLSVDGMSLSVKAGFVSGAQPGAEAQRQWRLAISATIAAAHTYASEGVHVAIDSFALPIHLPMWEPLRAFAFGVVVLLPDVEVAVQRNGHRQATTGWGVPEADVRANHEMMSRWMDEANVLVVDNSELELTSVVAAVEEGYPRRT